MMVWILIVVPGVLLAYLYAGYPAWLWLWGAVRRRDDGPGTYRPASVSVAICARNEEGRIEARIRNLLTQTEMPADFEVVIASDGSTDGTAEAARRAGAGHPVRVLEYPEQRGKAAVLNDVIPSCRGEIVVLGDARQDFAPNAVSRLCRHFGDAAVGAVSGELAFRRETGDGSVAEGLDAYWTLEKWLRRRESGVDSTCGCTGAIYALRRECFRPIHPDTILDDVAIPMLIAMQGKRVVFESDALAFDVPLRDRRAEQRRKVRTLAGNLQLCSLYPAFLDPFRHRLAWQFVSHKLLRLVAPWLLLVMAIGSAVLATTNDLGRLLVAAQAVFYGLAAAGLAGGRAASHPFLAWPAAFVSLNWAAAQAWFVWLRGGLRGKW